MNLREIEPFAVGFLEADRENIEYRVACGLREMAQYLPLGIGKFVSPALYPFGVNYRCKTGISVNRVKLESEAKDCPGVADLIEKISAFDTESIVWKALSESDRQLAGKQPIGGRYIRTCWGGTWIGHSNPDYRMLLRLGTSGLRERVEIGRKMNPGTNDFYDSLIITLDAIDILGKRSLELAKKNGEERLARAFENIPENKPRDFFEACQLFWLVFVFDGIDSPGRFDLFMDDFVGLSDEKERDECLRALWKLFYETRTWNLCIGGSDENGNYFSNALTYDILRIAREYKYNTPNLTMRMSRNMPDDLWKEAAKTISSGIGMPALYNDECVCPALEDLGISPVDSHNYCMNGCNQIDIFGKSHMGLEDGEVCLAKCLELTLHNGKCGLTGEKLGIETGKADGLDSFEKLLAAYKKQVEYITDRTIDMSDRAQRIYAKYAPNPLRSILIQGCVENGRDYKNGGPVYNHGQILTEGIADTVDSLASLRHFVYDIKKYTLEEVVDALDRDFEGYDEMLEDFRSYPKYGNDVPEVDGICADIVEHFYRYLLTKRTFRGGIYGGGCSTFNRSAVYGGSIGALPNGKRRDSDLLADSIGAVPGNDKNGPTALIRSVLRQPQRLAKSGNVLNLKFTKELFTGDAGEEAFIALAKTYFRKGGQQLSVSVVSADELRKARECPERYENLIVRVGGYSDYFTRLSRGLQDNIIARTEIGL